MKMDPNKKYRTRDGREVKHLYRVPDGYPTAYPWRGIVANIEESWTDGGEYDVAAEREADSLDLIEVREPREWKAVVCIKDGVLPSGHLAHYDEGDELDPNYEIVRVREIID